MSFDLETYLSERKLKVEETLKSLWLPAKTQDPTILYEAMHYSLFADGKRIRPILTLASGELLGLTEDDVMPIAASLEMIHVFSLIHDDLPAMDDDDLRRGQPTNHKVYGDAIAILAGDGLLAQAFLPLTAFDLTKFSAQNVFSLICLIIESTGAPGMIGGQVIDMESEGKMISLDRLKTLHRMKTGALIKAAVVGPAILSGAEAKTKMALENYGDAIGLAFQIADDILDVEGGVEIGKDLGSDGARGKSTYPSLMGIDEAKRESMRTLEKALFALEEFDEKAEPLRAIARYIVKRKK